MPISDCEVRDPRIRRTRQLLQGALRDLMQTRSFDEISVQDITDAATVNRATFYDHYTDKFALLDAMVGGGFHKLLHERNVSFDGTCPSAAASIILATCDYLTESHGDRAACTRQNAFEPLMESAMTAAIRKVLIKGMEKDGSAGASEMVATTASWAIYGAVKQWFYTSEHVPAEEIVGRILQLVMPILEAGRTLESADAPVMAHDQV
ncbi:MULTISPECIES: TetR/AcrR family transcriptional regulator [Acidobacteriaceae]|uniref:TetR/AcrR family transcriptional regulator n=1 Tax=Acidobacteriaceae TaxID=204434 RepID=UPI00131E05BB|nr:MULTISPECIES: TetR family transcriptional regulator [Acidobacteriaceae]MDW5264577.1 TetR family transcriptional regulator [Edaphobacter sp.]